MERSSLGNSYISFSGTWALTWVLEPASMSVPPTLPRFPLRSDITSPMNFSGTVTTTSMMGSRSTGCASRQASRMAIAPAIWNAMSLPSTGWVEPSTKVTWTSTMGLPTSTPSSIALRTPFSTEGRKF